MNPDEPKKLFSVKYTMKKEQIQDFVNSLYEIQDSFVEAAVAKKEREGFPEATEVINRVKGRCG